MKTARMNKKGLIWGVSLTLIFIGVMTTAFFMLQTKIAGPEYKIGESQVQLMQRYAQGERAQLYLEEASKQALIQSIHDFGNKGMLKNASCGTYKGISLWDESDDACSVTAFDAKKNFESTYAINLNKLLLNYEETGFQEISSADLELLNGLAVKSKTNKKIVISKPSITVDRDRQFYQWPTDAPYLTSCFGYRGCVNPQPDGTCHGTRYHPGIDIGTNGVPAPVYAVADGKVTRTVPDWGKVEIDHYQIIPKFDKVEEEYKGMMTVYTHMDETFVKVGDVVKKGQKIGTTGGRGTKNGVVRRDAYDVHLHFEVRDDTVGDELKIGRATDPRPYFAREIRVGQYCGKSCQISCTSGSKAQYSLPFIFETQNFSYDLDFIIENIAQTVESCSESQNYTTAISCVSQVKSLNVDMNEECGLDRAELENDRVVVLCAQVEDIDCTYKGQECKDKEDNANYLYFDSSANATVQDKLMIKVGFKI